MALFSVSKMASLSKVNGYKALLRQQKFWSNLAPRCSMSLMKSVSPEQHKILKEEFYEKNERLKRPLSPHLTIYKPQMTSMLSITHRGTGAALTGFLYGAAIGTMVLPGTFPSYIEALQGMHLGGAILFVGKFAIAWPFSFHFLNGIRHLCWDMGWGFTLPDLYKTGYAVMILSVIMGAALAAL